MIIVDQNNEISNWVESIKGFKLGSVKLDSITFELANNLGHELILFNHKLLEKASPEILKKLDACNYVILFSDSEQVMDRVPKNLVGIINRDISSQASYNILVHIVDLIKTNSILKSQLISLDSEISSIMGGVESEMMRAKKSYEKMTPKRLSELGDLDIYTKYAAGENQGGEFFDTFAVDNQVFILMSHTSSYLASGSILQAFNEFRRRKEINREAELDLITKIKEAIEKLDHQSDKRITGQVMTAILDVDQMKIFGHSLGNFKFISSNLKNTLETVNSLEKDIELSTFSMELDRGERLMICSPGLTMNWQSLNPEFMVEELIINKKIKLLDVLDEVFFQLKKDTEHGFLNSDASSIILEVRDDSIHEA